MSSVNRRTFVIATLGAMVGLPTQSKTSKNNDYIIDDLKLPAPRATNGAKWSLVSDRVMGGLSKGSMSREIVSGRTAIRMRGAVSLENNGGFIQIAIDLKPDGSKLDGSVWEGVEIDVLGNNEEYSLHLRTTDLGRPWQSYRHAFTAEAQWRSVKIPFNEFKAYRTDAPLNLKRLRRLGIVAIGREFTADLAIAGVRFYR